MIMFWSFLLLAISVLVQHFLKNLGKRKANKKEKTYSQEKAQQYHEEMTES